MEKFGVSDNVKTLVRFNRGHYAKLVSQEFKPPLIFNVSDQADPIYKASILGIKVSCGLEMMYSRGSKNIKTIPDNEQELLLKYIKEECENFSNNMGSKYLNNDSFDLQTVSEIDYFNNTEEVDNDTETDVFLTSKGSLTVDYLFSKMQCSDLEKENYFESSETEDSDEWMNIDPEDLDVLIKSVQDKMEKDKIFDVDVGSQQYEFDSFTNDEKKAAENLKQTVNNIQTFLKTESSYMGAELAEEDSIEEMSSDDDSYYMKKEKQNKSLSQKRGKNMKSVESSRNRMLVGSDIDFDELTDEEIDIDTVSVFDNIKKLLGTEFLGTEEIDVAKKQNDESSLEEITRSMDLELASTNVAKSFDSTFSKITSKDSTVKNIFEDTHGKHLNKSSDVKPTENNHMYDSDISDSEDYGGELSDVDIDANMVRNMLESFKSQQGLSGPAGILFNQFSFAPPKDKDDSSK
ncbi:hypothetical protein BB559_000451 [Furculomyces boomerangus]|uniref:Uncharacterized protein n=1 Tax=Furculomyces boomerangus TaxID=61424 RepID=A0A2T9Z5B3_9FUNG|nr:hypothetical protein BB559_000451 [Furculomyces boomerangus]